MLKILKGDAMNVAKFDNGNVVAEGFNTYEEAYNYIRSLPELTIQVDASTWFQVIKKEEIWFYRITEAQYVIFANGERYSTFNNRWDALASFNSILSSDFITGYSDGGIVAENAEGRIVLWEIREV